jgi:hypothetical protein
MMTAVVDLIRVRLPHLILTKIHATSMKATMVEGTMVEATMVGAIMAEAAVTAVETHSLRLPEACSWWSYTGYLLCLAMDDPIP